MRHCFTIILLFLTVHLLSQQWTPVGLRTAAMKSAGLLPGEGGQYHTGFARSKSHPRIMYTCFDVGHVEKTTDGGATWQYMLQSGLKAGGMCSVEIHPSDTNTIFGYGNFINYKTDSESGIFRTTDGGTTWTKVLGLTNTYYSADDVSSGVGGHHQIEIDPSNPQRIYFGSYQQGFYRSLNGGITWTKTSDTALDSGSIRVVRVDPFNAAKILVGTDEGELWVSVDSGASLSRVVDPGFPAGTIIGNIVFHPATRNTVFISVENKGVYKSTTGGSSTGSYSLMTGTAKTAVILFDISPAAKDDGSDQMYLMTKSTSSPQAYYSHNSGAGWTSGFINTSATFHGSASTWIGGVTSISCDPADKNIAIATIGTRVYKTTDGGITWQPSNAGHQGFAFGRGALPGIFFDPSDPKKMWTFNYDFGTVATTDNWDTAERLTGMSLPSPSWGAHQLGGLVLPSGRIFALGGTYYNHVICKKDPGNSWQALTASYTYTTSASSINVSTAEYIETIQVHSNGSTVYVSNIRSDDGGNTWTKMADGSYHILGMYKKNCHIIYAARYTVSGERTNTRIIYKSTDKGNSWTPLIEAPLRVGYSWTSICYFAVDPLKEDRFYTVSPTSTYSIIKYDAGNWSMNTPVYGKELRSIAIDPNSSNIIYCTLLAKGEAFIYKSEDYGSTWTSIQGNHPMQGSAYLAVCPHDGSLYANSELGMWRLKGNTWPVRIQDSNVGQSLSILAYPNPFQYETAFRYSLPAASDVKLEIYNYTGQKIRTLVNEKQTPGDHEVIWNGRNDLKQNVSDGAYIGILKAGMIVSRIKLMRLK